MSCTPAPACKAALAEAAQKWPGRNRASDGICPSATHSQQNPTSDHERGLAFDLTHDVAHGVDCDRLAAHVIHDPRVTYVIWNRRIWSRARRYQGWRPYSGSNPHTKHMHVSIDVGARDDVRAWWPQEEPLTPEDKAWLVDLVNAAAERIVEAVVGPDRQLDGTRWNQAELADLIFKQGRGEL